MIGTPPPAAAGTNAPWRRMRPSRRPTWPRPSTASGCAPWGCAGPRSSSRSGSTKPHATENEDDEGDVDRDLVHARVPDVLRAGPATLLGAGTDRRGNKQLREVPRLHGGAGGGGHAGGAGQR